MGDVREEMVRDIAERKADKRKNLEAEYEEKLGGLIEEIERVRRESEESALQVRRNQLDRLTRAISRKTEIERQLASATADLAERYEQMKQELKVAVTGKLQDIVQAETILVEELNVGQATVARQNDGAAEKYGLGGAAPAGLETAQLGHPTGSGKATQDGKGVITDVPARKQVEGADEIGMMGRRV